MAYYLEDEKVLKLSREVNYLRSMLYSLKLVEDGPNITLKEIVEQQETVLNTLEIIFAEKVADFEQRLKKNTLRIIGIPEHPNQEEDIISTVLDFFKKKLKLHVTIKDLDYVYRCGAVKEKHYRSVIVKLVNDYMCKKILKRRDALVHDTNLEIREELSTERAKMWKLAIRKFGKKRVSIKDGMVEVMTPNGDYERFPTVPKCEELLGNDQ